LNLSRPQIKLRAKPALFVVALGLLFLLPFLAGCSFSLAADITPPPGSEVRAPVQTQPPVSSAAFPLMAPDPGAGASIYADKCTPCHGSTGKGNGPQAGQLPNQPSPLGSPEFARQASPAGWYRIVTQGNLERFMPPFTGLTDRQRWDVVAYAFTLSTSPEQVARGRQIYQENCVACHGVGGKGDGIEAAGLTASPPDFTSQEWMAEKTGAQLFQAIGDGIPPDMPAYGDQLTEEERWDLVGFLRSLTFNSQAAALEPARTPPAVATGTAETAEATPPVPPAAGTGTIKGQVVLATSGGTLPSTLSVTLHGFDQMQQVLTETTEVQPDGSFKFEEIAMPEGRAFLASLEYQGVAYNSDIGVVEPGITELSLPIPFYETTKDLSVIFTDRLHLLFEYIEPSTLRVIELYVISNRSDRILVAETEGEPVLTFPLPPGATNLQFEDGALGGRYVQTPEGFGDTSVIRPGISQHQVVFSYDLPYSNKLDFSHKLDLPVNAVTILLPADGLKVSGAQLQDMGLSEVQGITYQMYSTSRIEAGSGLRLVVSGRPRGSAGVSLSSSSSLVIGLLAFGGVLIIGGLWLFRRSRAGSGEAYTEEGEEAGFARVGLDEDLNTMLDAILALDDQYQAGELPEEAYRERRAALKARVQMMMKGEIPGND
jgi:mono/diheme cytochrome c family protein